MAYRYNYVTCYIIVRYIIVLYMLLYHIMCYKLIVHIQHINVECNI